MKTKAYMILQLLLYLSFVGISQNMEAGVYLCAEDFKKQKTSYASKHTRLKLHEVFKKDLIEIKTKDSTYTFKKKSIYGYRDKGGNSYRFYEDKIFTVINPGETIVIYKVSSLLPQKGQVLIYKYYFSAEADKKICPLELYQLEGAFSQNQSFLELLEIHFTTTSNLLEYDKFHKMYKINRLWMISTNKKE